MAEWIRDLRGVLLFDEATFLRFRDSRDSVLRGAILIVVVALLAALPTFVLNAARGLQGQPAIDAEAAQATAGFESALQQMGPLMANVPPAVLQQIQQNFETGLQIGVQIERLPTVLPRPVARFLEALGTWLQTPFNGGLIPLSSASLATWLGYGVWVMLFAKLLGGRATLRAFFGASSLFATPHLLNVFGFVPVLGPLLALIAWFWGLGIYVKSTAVSHEMTAGRALLVVFLPAIVLFCAVLLLLLLIIGIVLASRGGR